MTEPQTRVEQAESWLAEAWSQRIIEIEHNWPEPTPRRPELVRLIRLEPEFAREALERLGSMGKPEGLCDVADACMLVADRKVPVMDASGKGTAWAWACVHHAKQYEANE